MPTPSISISSPAADAVLDISSGLSVTVDYDTDGLGSNLTGFVCYLRQTNAYNSQGAGPGDFWSSGSNPTIYNSDESPTQVALNKGAVKWIPLSATDHSKVFSYTAGEMSSLTNGANFEIGVIIVYDAGLPRKAFFATDNSFKFDGRRFKGFTGKPSKVTTGTPLGGYHSASGTINWSNATGAQTYNIRLGTTSGANDIATGTDLTSSNFPYSGLTPGDEIFVRVDTVNIIGTTTGTVWSFTVLDVPSVPSLSAPADSATDQLRKPTLSWTDAGDATNAASSYKVYLNKVDASSWVSTQSELSYVPPSNLAPGTTYYWKVIAVNVVGESAPATVRSFTTEGITAGEPSTTAGFKRKLCVASGNSFYYEDDDNQMRKLHGLVLDTTEPIIMAPAFNSMFIANGTIRKVVDFSSKKLKFESLGGSPTAPGSPTIPGNGDKITGDDSGAQMTVTHWPGGSHVYGVMITAVPFQNHEELFLDGVTIEDGSSNNLQADGAEESGDPYWYYDWQEDGAPAVPNINMPAVSSVVVEYGGRLVLLDRNVFYMSRSGDPFDYTYAQDDTQSAVAGVATEAGAIGDVLVGAIPVRDDYLILGATTSLRIIKGNPQAGGNIELLDPNENMFSSTSWCYGEAGSVYIMGTNAITRISANLEIEDININVIPNLVTDLGLNQNDHRVTLEYDKRKYGISIKVVEVATGATTGYWYDLRTVGFFPDDIDSSIAPMSQYFYDSNINSFREMLIGSSDGIIRYYNDSQKSDELGWAFKSSPGAIISYVLLGPMQLGPDRNLTQILNRLSFILAGGDSGGVQADTDAITYEVYIAPTAEQVIEKANAGDYFSTGTITGPGRAKDKRIRARAVFAGILIKNITVAETWAIEEVIGEFLAFGRVR